MAQPGGSNVPPWNKGRKVGQKRALRPQEVWLIRDRLRAEGRVRDLALFNLALDSKLPARDLVCLQVSDVWYPHRVRQRGRVVLQRTGKPLQFEITNETKAAITEWLSLLGSPKRQKYLFPAGSIRDRIFQGGNILASFAIGSKVRDLTPMCTGHNRCGAPRCC